MHMPMSVKSLRQEENVHALQVLLQGQVAVNKWYRWGLTSGMRIPATAAMAYRQWISSACLYLHHQDGFISQCWLKNRS